MMLIDLENGSDDTSTSVTDRRMRSDAYTEAAFPINKSRHIVGRQHPDRPSLLIVRTGHVVTAHAATPSTACDTNE